MTAPVALVTGSAQGIGRCIADHLQRQGWHLVLVDRQQAAGEAARLALPAPDRAQFHCLDVADDTAVRGCLEQVAKQIGRLDGLVNNAGYFRAQPLTEQSLADWRDLLDSHLTGAMLCAKYAYPLLAEQRGAVVNITSTRALQSEPDTEAYAAAKGGLLALTHALAVSWQGKVRVNAVAPGWIDTRHWLPAATPAPEPLTDADHAQHPAGRVGRPEDIAAAAAYLLGPDSGFVTGAQWVIDGGMTRKMIYQE